jgi:putative oxygen-independent coproporphyrinogen III oxidase
MSISKNETPIQFIPKAKQTVSDVVLTALPPLSLYIHIPWCLRKCPYCDFNSHEINTGTDFSVLESAYVDALTQDLDNTLPQVWGRRVSSIFIGGGTPSVLSAQSMDAILSAVRARLPQVSEIEVTMEANPGTLDTDKLRDFRAAGVTRLSLGVQSFDDGLLDSIGRIHTGKQARVALDTAYQLFDKVNLDLMFALPNQTLAQLKNDVATALSYHPTHLSYYHLTIEPNTFFHQHPPSVPDDEAAIDMQEWIQSELASQGLRHYEVSAYAQARHECQHNTNYWLFGDYIGIGAGAHGKISSHNQIVRTAKFKHPKRYLDAMQQGGAIETEQVLRKADLPFEYMLNALRLRDGATLAQMQTATGLNVADLEPALTEAQTRDLMVKDAGVLRVTDLGWRFLSDVQTMFLR